MAITNEITDRFNQIINDQLKRITDIQSNQEWVNYETKQQITIGICPGDGIGPEICSQALRVLNHVLAPQINDKRIIIEQINGLTIENRAACNQAIPPDVLKQLKSCDVILKGPTTTPQKGDQWPNIESANVAMRRELDLFACVRPINVAEASINWTFFRENTEGAYTLGSKGIDITDLLSVDFKICTTPGAERIIRLAFEYAKKNNKKKVTIVTKSNVVKATDGKFSEIAKQISKEYIDDNIECDEWYVDIMAAKMIDPSRQSQFEVIVCPNLYGDILTDLAGQIQGGVGTAGSANIGTQYAMFEAIHGSAPRMVAENRAQYADPSSMIRAAAMLLSHIGYTELANHVETAIIDTNLSSHTITGNETGLTATEYTNKLLSNCAI